MEYGVYVGGSRPASKKQIKEALTTGLNRVTLENTSMFGNSPSGYVSDLPDGTYTFVGPDPYNRRNFYGNIVKAGGKITVK